MTQPHRCLILLAGLIAAALPACGTDSPADEAEKKHDAIVALTAAEALELHDKPQNLPDKLAAAYTAIRPRDAYETCKWLAHPFFAGRYPGTDEYRQVCDWTAGRFRAWGLKPGAPDGGYLQPYASPYSIIEDASLKISVPGTGEDAGTMKETVIEPGTDFLPHLYSDSGDAEGRAVFVGWGISAPDLGYDDYEGVNVQNRFVICFRGTPDRSNRAFEVHDHHRKRMVTARENGALGLFYIYADVGANPNGDRIEGFMPAVISEKVADRVLAPSGTDSAKLRRELRETKKPRSFETQCRIALQVQAAYYPEAEAYNVVGWIEGSDPELKNEFIVIGGHLDHCGYHMGLLFAGADDNASGSACVMEAAKAFGRLERVPKRSVLFVLFGSEESGLIGSKLHADTPPPGGGTIAAMINLDMQGEGDGVGAVVRPDHPELKKAVEMADMTVDTVDRIREFSGPPGVRGSDYAPYYMNGVPCIAFWSNGPHLHYHQTGDTIYRINPDMLADVSRLTFLTAYYLADR